MMRRLLWGMLLVGTVAAAGGEIERIERITAEIAQLREALHACRQGAQVSEEPIAAAMSPTPLKQCEARSAELRKSIALIGADHKASKAVIASLSKELEAVKEKLVSVRRTGAAALEIQHSKAQKEAFILEQKIETMSRRLKKTENALAALKAKYRLKQKPKTVKKIKTIEQVRRVEQQCGDPNPFPKLLKKESPQNRK